MTRRGWIGLRRRRLAAAGLVLALACLGLWRLWAVAPPSTSSGATQSPGAPPATRGPDAGHVASTANAAAGSPTPDPGPPDADSPESESPDDDQRLSQRVVGTWEDEYQGKRTMTIREDGTGSMVVELTGLSARLFADRLEFEMVWSVCDGRLQARTTGGEPATAVSLILATFGDRADQAILELTDDRLLLLDQDGTTQYDWQRVR